MLDLDTSRPCRSFPCDPPPQLLLWRPLPPHPALLRHHPQRQTKEKEEQEARGRQHRGGGGEVGRPCPPTLMTTQLRPLQHSLTLPVHPLRALWTNQTCRSVVWLRRRSWRGSCRSALRPSREPLTWAWSVSEAPCLQLLWRSRFGDV